MAEQNTKQAGPVMDESNNGNEAFFLKYKTAIIGCFVALVLIIAGGMWFKSYKAEQNEKASTAMAKAQDNFMNGNYELALNGDSTGVAGFLKIASEYGSTDAGNLANPMQVFAMQTSASGRTQHSLSRSSTTLTTRWYHQLHWVLWVTCMQTSTSSTRLLAL